MQLNLDSLRYQRPYQVQSETYRSSEINRGSENNIPFVTPFALWVLAKGLSSSEELMIWI